MNSNQSIVRRGQTLSVPDTVLCASKRSREDYYHFEVINFEILWNNEIFEISNDKVGSKFFSFRDNQFSTIDLVLNRDLLCFSML